MPISHSLALNRLRPSFRQQLSRPEPYQIAEASPVQGGFEKSIESKRVKPTRGVHCVRCVAFKPLQRPIASTPFPVRTPLTGGRGICLKAALRMRRASAPILTVPESLLRELEREAAARGVKKSTVNRDSLHQTLSGARNAKKQVSCLDLMGDWVGQVAGPADASTNPRYFEASVLADRMNRLGC